MPSSQRPHEAISGVLRGPARSWDPKWSVRSQLLCKAWCSPSMSADDCGCHSSSEGVGQPREARYTEGESIVAWPTEFSLFGFASCSTAQCRFSMFNFVGSRTGNDDGGTGNSSQEVVRTLAGAERTWASLPVILPLVHWSIPFDAFECSDWTNWAKFVRARRQDWQK